MKPVKDPAMQGEGNYTAARRHRKSVEKFVGEGRVDEAARQARPDDPKQAAELAKAEKKGKSKARK
jgi:hypothetical protein